jgi:YegS/Rv2252/BmrU family lipid kinase
MLQWPAFTVDGWAVGRMDYLYVNPAAGTARDHGFWLSCLVRHGIDALPVAADDTRGLPPMGETDRLIAAGGDGTMNRLAPWCIEHGCVLGVLPAGTGNDFARGLGIPLAPDAACRNLAHGVVRRVDVGRIGEGIFLNVAHVGLGSEVSREVGAADKHWWGRFSYLRRLLRRVRWRRGFRATIVCGGLRRRSRWLEIAVANGGSFGGGHRIFEASSFDGRLDVIAIRARPLHRLLLIWVRAQLFNATPADPAVVKLHGEHCVIRHCHRHPVSADGEPAGETPAEFQVQQQALRVTVPRGPAAA